MKFQLALGFLLFSEVCGRVPKQKNIKKTNKFPKRNFSHEKVVSLSDEFDEPKRITPSYSELLANLEDYIQNHGQNPVGDGSCLEDAPYYLTNGNLYSRTYDACSETTGATIGVGSCTMSRACECTSYYTVIGDGSCTGTQSCNQAVRDMETHGEVTIGNGSCTGTRSCYMMNANVGDNACTEAYYYDYYNRGERRYGCSGYKGLCGVVPSGCPSISAWIAGDCSSAWCTPAGTCEGMNTCTSTQPGTIISAGSCNGDFSCSGVGSTYTPELDAIGGDGIVTIGNDSCIGRGSCTRVQSDIGPNSCEGEYSCQYCSGDVAENSCRGYRSCRGIGAAIDAGSCQGEYSCYERRQTSGTVGAGSCIGDRSCYAYRIEAQSIGAGSCLGERSCHLVSVSVGNNSCTGPNSCEDYSGQRPIPDNCPSVAELQAGNC